MSAEKSDAFLLKSKYENCQHTGVDYLHVHHAGVDGCTMACRRLCRHCGSSNFYRKNGVSDYDGTGWLPVDEDRDMDLILSHANVPREKAERLYHEYNRDVVKTLTMLKMLEALPGLW